MPKYISKKHGNSWQHRLKDINKARHEGFAVLENIEDEFRHDLGVHLYSSFLIRLKTQGQYPYRSWTAWPLPYDRLVDCKHSRVYVDEEGVSLAGAQEQTSQKQQKQQVQRDINRTIATLSQLDDVQKEFRSNNNPDILQSIQNGIVSQQPEYRFELDNGNENGNESEKEVEFEVLSDPEKALESEINVLYQSIIYKKIQNFNNQNKLKRNNTKKFQPIVDPSIKIPSKIFQKIKKLIDFLILKIIILKYHTTSSRQISFNTGKKTKSHSLVKNAKLFDWQDILLMLSNCPSNKKSHQFLFQKTLNHSRYLFYDLANDFLIQHQNNSNQNINQDEFSDNDNDLSDNANEGRIVLSKHNHTNTNNSTNNSTNTNTNTIQLKMSLIQYYKYETLMANIRVSNTLNSPNDNYTSSLKRTYELYKHSQYTPSINTFNKHSQ
ncbi:uncharacterized protein ASCRUDRAFT_98611 [Ascoidea rubescens DSM 1968]|uniref:Rrn9 domain-containing protein n=1 Tax=Ascoidea rubescens DSM 1968 TaxID=1344418 RepID=A0A1D2VQ74_9ASCO|nr:hypothetical protein ASCRUDRAFT_98611 [Ascoidea rubescens DSM 1968]ODV63761.1 hypothetical protein ASCRUDRAFT_98611 [Ascoidea rubescens DSM 1968]